MGIGDWGLGIGDWAQSPIHLKFYNYNNNYNNIWNIKIILYLK